MQQCRRPTLENSKAHTKEYILLLLKLMKASLEPIGRIVTLKASRLRLLVVEGPRPRVA